MGAFLKLTHNKLLLRTILHPNDRSHMSERSLALELCLAFTTYIYRGYIPHVWSPATAAILMRRLRQNDDESSDSEAATVRLIIITDRRMMDHCQV